MLCTLNISIERRSQLLNLQGEPPPPYNKTTIIKPSIRWTWPWMPNNTKRALVEKPIISNCPFWCKGLSTLDAFSVVSWVINSKQTGVDTVNSDAQRRSRAKGKIGQPCTILYNIYSWRSFTYRSDFVCVFCSMVVRPKNSLLWLKLEFRLVKRAELQWRNMEQNGGLLHCCHFAQSDLDT